MKVALNVNINFEQILFLVKQLPQKDKIKLSQELDKEGIHSKLSSLLKTFKTNELSQEIIDEEVEIVRQKNF